MVGRRRVLGLLGLLAAPGPGRAEEMAVFRIEMKDGAITPPRLAVPANRPFKIEIANVGRTPAEFESTELYKEKVLAPGATSAIVFRRLERGEYVFFDDFHPGARLVLESR